MESAKIVPIDVAPDGRITTTKREIEALEFNARAVAENAVEEFLRHDIGLIFEVDEEAETLLVVGRPVCRSSTGGGRATTSSP